MDKIIAILPIEIKGFGVGSQIYYENRIIEDKRTCLLFLKHMCDERSISTKLMKKRMKNILKVSRNLPYCIDSFNVFFPFKINQSDNDDFRRAFVNCYYVSDIKDSTIYLKNGLNLASLNRDKALKSNFNNASKIMYMQFAKDLAKIGRSMDFINKIDSLVV